MRCLVDVPGQKVPSIATGEMANYLKTVVAPQVVLPFKNTSDLFVIAISAEYFFQHDAITDNFILSDSSRNL